MLHSAINESGYFYNGDPLREGSVLLINAVDNTDC